MATAPAFIIAAVSGDPAKPAGYFAGWADRMDQCAASFVGRASEARRFTAADEAVVEARLLAPAWPTRTMAVVAIQQPPVTAL